MGSAALTGVSEEMQSAVDGLATCIWMTVNGEVALQIEITNGLKEQAAPVVASLKSMG